MWTKIMREFSTIWHTAMLRKNRGGSSTWFLQIFSLGFTSTVGFSWCSIRKLGLTAPDSGPQARTSPDCCECLPILTPFQKLGTSNPTLFHFQLVQDLFEWAEKSQSFFMGVNWDRELRKNEGYREGGIRNRAGYHSTKANEHKICSTIWITREV